MDRRGAQREIDNGRPILLRHQLVFALRPVRMRIHQPGNDGFPGYIYELCARRHRHVAALANCHDAIALNQDHPVIDDAAIGCRHAHDACAAQCNCGRWLVGHNLARQ